MRGGGLVYELIALIIYWQRARNRVSVRNMLVCMDIFRMHVHSGGPACVRALASHSRSYDIRSPLIYLRARPRTSVVFLFFPRAARALALSSDLMQTNSAILKVPDAASIR